eukprot:scaffold55249_cov19-Tisochrysis_lutea.AAC.4
MKDIQKGYASGGEVREKACSVPFSIGRKHMGTQERRKTAYFSSRRPYSTCIYVMQSQTVRAASELQDLMASNDPDLDCMERSLLCIVGISRAFGVVFVTSAFQILIIQSMVCSNHPIC